uniref:Uncharacterized protein n=1 Tax=Davidia involucrata TaxID=16924 RepID=A0A5B7BJ84_DAVIN
MAVVMKQLNRSDEAIEAIKSFRHLCPPESQESLDNVLVELYKRSGRIEEQIEMLQLKLKHIEEGIAFGGKRTKTARSQGKKIQITIEQEYSRLLGNLAWGYLQQNKYKPAEELYRKALSLEADKNKQCNLAICLMHMNRMTEAKFMLQTIRDSSEDGEMDESYAKSFERAIQTLTELESQSIVAVEEIRTPFTSSLINRNLKEFSTSINHVSGFGVSRRLAFGGHDETVLLDHEQNSGSCFHLYGSDKGISKWPRQYSRQTSFVNKMKNRYERRVGGTEVGSSCKEEGYDSAVAAREFPKAPFTQPRSRRCSWSFNNGDWRRAWVGNEQQRIAAENYDGQLLASPKETTLQKSKCCCSPSTTTSQDWRKRLWNDHADADAEVNNEYVLQPIVNGGDWKLNSWGNDDDGHKKESNSPTESAVAFYYARGVRESSSDGDWKRSYNIPIEQGSVRLTENLKSTQELQSQSQPIAENIEHPQEFSMCKSWADMVEEDEQEEELFKTDFGESSYYFQTPSEGGWDGGEEFNDENMNSNISPSDQIENISRKIESFNIKDGYYTQPQNVRCALCFDQQQQQKPDNFYSSKKTLNFEGFNSFLANERECTSSGNSIKLLRRNRLQVFRDITPFPESPRP